MEVLAGLLQILTFIREMLSGIAGLLSNLIPFPQTNIILILNIILSLFLSAQITKLFPDKNKMMWFIILGAILYYLLTGYGL